VTELREQLERLATRGTARGADAVVDAAVAAAERARGNGSNNASDDAAPGVFEPREPATDDGTPVVALEDRRRRRSPWRNAVAVAGLAALVGVTMVAVTAIGNGGGASSPDGAVRALAQAIDDEDPLAAVAVIAPDEVRTLQQTVDAAQRRAAEIELVDRAGAPFAGLDVRVDDLQLATEQLADGYVKVHLTGGVISATVDRAKVSPTVRDLMSADGTTHWSASFAQSHPFDTDPFVIAVRRDGHWYVSAAYTALEYVRAANDLPAADYGSAAGAAASLGAATPELAAKELVTAIGSQQWTRVFSLVPPDELPLYDYREALSRFLDDQSWELAVTDVEASAQVRGDQATVEVTARGTTGSGEGVQQWVLAADCVRTTSPPSDLEPFTTGFCLSRRGTFPATLFLDRTNNGNGPAVVQTIKRDGRWFVSPVATAVDILDSWVGNFDRRTLLSMFGRYGDIPVDGTLTLGEPVEFDAEAYGVAHVYTFEGRKGQRVVANIGDNAMFDGMLFDENGADTSGIGGVLRGYPATLPADGTYKLAVVPYRAGHVSFTLWDANDAPAGTIAPYAACVDDPNAAVCNEAGLDGQITPGDRPTATTAVAVPTSVVGTQP
jgi:hypothetical protein